MMQKEGRLEICAVCEVGAKEGEDSRENINTMAYMNAGWVARVGGEMKGERVVEKFLLLASDAFVVSRLRNLYFVA
jgi:hypothetical protein